MRLKLLIFITAIFFVSSVFGQTEEENLSRKERRKKRPAYIEIGTGSNYCKFRDFATSPLFYSGTGIVMSVSRIKKDEIRESNFGIMYSGGKPTTKDESYAVSLKNIFINYTQLYQIKKLSNEKWNFKVGGTFNSSMDLRINESLQNNAVGYEGFFTLFGSAKLSRDLSRKKTKNYKLWFIKINLEPRERKLSYQFNLGLMNNTLRNGYAYSGQSGIINDSKILDGYQFQSFSGYRLSSQLDYRLSLRKNRNAIIFSYLWDAYKTGGDLDKMEAANHIFKFVLLFNTK